MTSCVPPGDVIEVSSTEELRARLVGRWRACPGARLLGYGHEGLELTVEGKWYLLRTDDTGHLVRKNGFDGSGTWSTTSNDAGSAANALSFESTLGGNWSYATFQEQPRALRLSNGEPSDYVWAGP